jgi:hypothetical protein
MRVRGVCDLEAARRSMQQASDFRSYSRFAIEAIASALSLPRHLTFNGPVPTRYSHCKGRAWPKSPKRLRNLSR